MTAFFNIFVDNLEGNWSTFLLLVLAASLDYLIGDPKNLLHPVQVMGWFVSSYCNLTIKYLSSKWQRKLAGVTLGCSLILGSAVVNWLIVTMANRIHPILGIGIATIMLASCFAGRSLRLAAEDVLQPLATGDLQTARTRLSQYVGRDTSQLSNSEVLRAVLETVAENAVDGVTAPLFYALVGACLPGVGSVPLAFAYKAASTLDSMVGYRREPYTDVGWFSAQLEDYLTWLPCRLTVITVAFLGRKPRQVWDLCRRDATKDPSPNSGWSECAYAAVLGVQLGGTNYYQGVAKHKPILGEEIYPITPEKIEQALQLNRHCFLLWLSIFMAIFTVLGCFYKLS